MQYRNKRKPFKSHLVQMHLGGAFMLLCLYIICLLITDRELFEL